MDFGVGYFPTHDGIGPGPVAALVEERGLRTASAGGLVGRPNRRPAQSILCLLLDREGQVAGRYVGIGTGPGEVYSEIRHDIEGLLAK